MKTFASILFVIVTFGAWGQCLDPVLTPAGPIEPGEQAAIVFDPVEGAVEYVVEARDPVGGGWQHLADLPSTEFDLPPFAFASDQDLEVRIISKNASDHVICVGEVTVEYEADLELRAEFGKAVIPVAGSVEGAYDSQWRTMMSLTNTRTRETLTGTIIFRPAGPAIADQLPSMEYSLAPGEVLQWDDVVTAMGATGLGSIDIVPDDSRSDEFFLGGYLPAIQTRIVNDTDDATYGTNVEAILVRDLAPPQVRRFLNGMYPSGSGSKGFGSAIIVPQDYGQTRLNIGFRYFNFSNLYWPQPLDPQGTPFVQLALRRGEEYVESVFREGVPGTMLQAPVEEIFTTQLMPGDVIVVRSVSALTYWTITDNQTNDPAFFFDIYEGQSKRIVYE